MQEPKEEQEAKDGRTDAKGQVTMIRFSGDVLGERFIAAGRSDGLIDFFSAKGTDLDYVETTRSSEGDSYCLGPVIDLCVDYVLVSRFQFGCFDPDPDVKFFCAHLDMCPQQTQKGRVVVL